MVVCQHLEFARRKGRGLLICNLKRTSAKLRRYLTQQRYTHTSLDVLIALPIPSKLRDQLVMVVYPGQAGATCTVTHGCAGLNNWLGGKLMGEGRFATWREIAGFMGISSRFGPYCISLRYYSDYQVCSLLAEAVHSKVADFAATVVSQYLGGRRAEPSQVESSRVESSREERRGD